jgi:hypothetical protein
MDPNRTGADTPAVTRYATLLPLPPYGAYPSLYLPWPRSPRPLVFLLCVRSRPRALLAARDRAAAW